MIEDCKKEIFHAEKLLATGSLAIGWKKVHEKNLLRNQIALASLLAEPVFQIQKESYNNNVWIDAESEKEATANQCHGYKNRKLYPDPPVPEIKLLDSKEIYQVYHGASGTFNAGKSAGWNECLAEIKRLNGLGE